MNKIHPRHRLIQIVAIIGCLVAGYIVMQSLFLEQDLICKAASWTSCGDTEIILQATWLQPVNGIAGFMVFLYFAWCGFRLPRLDHESVRFRRLFLILANLSFSYAVFLRFLEITVSGKICPWCFLFFLCTIAIALPAWKEWAATRPKTDRTFLPRHFYLDMIKLTVVIVLISFGTVCSVSPFLPRINKTIRRNLTDAGFITTLEIGMKEAEADQLPYLVFAFSNLCPHCLQMAKTFNQRMTRQWLADYEKVALDVDKGGLFIEKYDITDVPITFIFNSEHELLDTIHGAVTVEEFIEKFQSAVPESIDRLP